jgi:hypothetical protein
MMNDAVNETKGVLFISSGKRELRPVGNESSAYQTCVESWERELKLIKISPTTNGGS